MRTLYLIRHGEPEFEGGIRRCIGVTDLALNAAGRKKAQRLNAYFNMHPLEAVYASPLGRAKETAEILSGGRYPVRIRETLRELDMGEWENVPLSELKKELSSEPARGESRTDGVRRFSEAIIKILKETTGDVAVVAHAGINCCELAALAGIPLEVSRALPQPYCGISRIEVEDSSQIDTPETSGRNEICYENENAGNDSRIRCMSENRLHVCTIGQMPNELPSDDDIVQIWKHYHTSADVIAHCRAVAKLAEEYGSQLAACGYEIRLDLIHCAALLHDVVRAKHDHPLEGARCVIREGYPILAPLIVQHHEWGRKVPADEVTGWPTSSPEDENGEFLYRLEAEALYLADKEVQGSTRVGIEARFEKSRKRCEESADPAAALAGHQRRYLQAKKIKEELEHEINQHGGCGRRCPLS
jgi:broad specificity phosphatase PhoE